ncbi:hypothetical protein [Streptomyces sp. NBC_01237]|uniref:hypothetical protein n=1 Tax=Streptomyces sp. NBC_01237 TaxID=2903790 RepID=UPI002DDBEF10|nr:hypothetical protein [Streptomyces sp. NBC_01237]WRZ76490.1 hypothetical protein OG251_35465 [Streptomyces sp. NBC_01237]
MTDDEQQLAALLDDLPGHEGARFWRGLKEAAGIYRIRSTMSSAVREAQDGDFGPLAAFVLDVFNRDAQLKDITTALATHLGSTLRARAWITDAIATADRVNRTHTGDPLDGLNGKW